jgi:hypothetical protein
MLAVRGFANRKAASKDTDDGIGQDERLRESQSRTLAAFA